MEHIFDWTWLYFFTLLASPAMPTYLSQSELEMIKAIAVQLEIADDKEAILLVPSDKTPIWADVQCLRFRYAIGKTLPPLVDAKRLPSLDQINNLMKFADEYHNYLGGINTSAWLRYQTIDKETLEITIREAEALRLFWMQGRTACTKSYGAYLRRVALKYLRDFDPDLYAIGDWPPPAPLWRFNQR